MVRAEKIREVSLVLIFFSCFLLTPIQASADADINPEQYCEGCSAFLTEMHKKMRLEHSLKAYGVETRVMTVMDDICDQQNFRTYAYIPPKMTQVCNHLKDNHEEILEAALIHFYSNHDEEDEMSDEWKAEICYEVTDICTNAVMENAGKEPQSASIVMDGVRKEVPLSPSGQGKVEL